MGEKLFLVGIRNVSKKVNKKIRWQELQIISKNLLKN